MFKRTIAAIAVSVVTMSSAQALTIDDFSETLLLADPGISFGTAFNAGTILGGEREAGITRDTGADPAMLSFNSGSTGTMSIANGTGGTSESTVVWDGVGTSGLGGIDLTQSSTQDSFDLRVVANDFAADVSIFVIDSSANISILTQSSPGGIPGPASIPFLFEYANFVGLADFTDVNAIGLVVDANLNATDIELDFFGTTTTVAEPGALVLLGLGLIGLGFARRRH